MGKYDEGDAHLEHLLEASSKPPSHRFWMAMFICMVVLAVVGFALLVTMDKRFACNTLGMSSFGCPHCEVSSTGFCRFGELCGIARSARGFEMYRGCFAENEMSKCGDALCPQNMICKNGRCLFSPVCQMNSPQSRFPWQPNDWPPKSDQDFYDRDPSQRGSVYNKDISLLLRGPDQMQSVLFNIQGDDEATTGISTVPNPPNKPHFNLVGSLLYEDTSTQPPAVWKPSARSLWPMNGISLSPSPDSRLPDVQTTVYGQSWTSQVPYRYLLDQEHRDKNPSVPRHVFGAYNVFEDTIAQPDDLHVSQFNMEWKTTRVRLTPKSSNMYMSLTLNSHPMGYARSEPPEGTPWRLVPSDDQQGDVATDFCWTEVSDTPAEGGVDGTRAPFQRVALAAPLNGASPDPWGFVDPRYCVPVTWSLGYVDAHGAVTDGAGVADWRQLGTKFTMYAVAALGKTPCEELLATPTDPSPTHGQLTGAYNLLNAGTWDAVAPIPVMKCESQTGCSNTCNLTSDATRTNCARDMNWVFYCEHPRS